MEERSVVIHKGGKEEKYKIYVEDYVLSYLKYETGSLEFSEIYFFGSRQDGGRKYVIYGAGRDKDISVFDTYDLLAEILCRLTQAGPVFMVREPEEIYQIKGFDVFYQDNGAMQNYMVSSKTSTSSVSAVEPSVYKAAASTHKTAAHKAFIHKASMRKADENKSAADKTAGGTPVKELEKMETGALRSHGMISAQLGVILIILVAIVINSANSYDKMKQLNRSAEEVFFAIENQEAADAASDSYAPGEGVSVEREQALGDGIEADKLAGAIEKGEAGQTEVGETDVSQADESGAGGERAEAGQTGISETGTGQTSAGETGTNESGTGQTSTNETGTGQTGTNEKGAEQTEGNDAGRKNTEAGSASKNTEENGGEGAEALSRNVTRYYEVERGDTLYTICQKIYGDISQVEKICELNDISDPDRIRSGQKIILP